VYKLTSAAAADDAADTAVRPASISERNKGRSSWLERIKFLLEEYENDGSDYVVRKALNENDSHIDARKITDYSEDFNTARAWQTVKQRFFSQSLIHVKREALRD
jgi:hypothetical protein